MKFILLIATLFIGAGVSAQTVKKNDLVGTWHFYRMVNDGKVVIDAADPSVAHKRVDERLAKTPKATDADKKKMHEQANQMQAVYTQLMATYNADGTTEQTSMETISTHAANIKGTYTLDEQTGKLQVTRPDVKELPSTITIKDGILTSEISGMTGMTMQFKK